MKHWFAFCSTTATTSQTSTRSICFTAPWKTWIRYDSTIVVGSKLIVSNYGDTEPGKMRSLEAVIFEK